MRKINKKYYNDSKTRRGLCDYLLKDIDLCDIDDTASKISTCAYEAQQCIELLLKFIIDQIYCKESPKKHNIKKLLNIIDNQTSFDFYYEDKLYDLSGTITQWEGSSRYDLEFGAAVEDIKIALEIYDNILEEVDFELWSLKNQELITW